MSEQTTTANATVGGFQGDLAEAFNPAAGSGCCGSPAATSTVTGAATSTAVAGPCCGTAQEAQAANSCCGTEAKAEAVSTGSCGCGS